MITIAAGRERHLARQRASLGSFCAPGRYVVVAMGDGATACCRQACGPEADVIAVDVGLQGLPLAHARNAGALHAIARGAELLVFLDVDCLPGPRLLERYQTAAASAPTSLLCGPVACLPPPGREGYRDEDLEELARPHPARPVPAEDALVHTRDHELFGTLSFAVTAETWRAVGGFCEDYVGYGGEDTDFGQLAARAGVDLCWVGGAWAYHQFHPTQDPPVHHLDDILRNAATFHRRWGWWPMIGWLKAFTELGLTDGLEPAEQWRLGQAGRSPTPP
ncbi:glycosyltransferase family 2 protein [Baekduia soli]|uniref:glycosyltransferase family 2 protein n=1 Tax=Baekduia soli TaxID=496014 RepID=UPI001E2F697A|nr:galactosyltransferase-related protein [Baekduia soli]